MALTSQQKSARAWAKAHGLRAVDSFTGGANLAPLLPESRTYLLGPQRSILLDNMVYFRGANDTVRVIISHPIQVDINGEYDSMADMIAGAKALAETANLRVFFGGPSDNVWDPGLQVFPLIWLNPARTVSKQFATLRGSSMELVVKAPSAL